MGMQRRLALTGAMAATAMTLAACGGFGNQPSGVGEDAAGYGGDTTQSSAPAAAAAPKIKWTLMTSSTKKFGKIMVDGGGMTLYRFDNDTAKPPVSHCAGTCAEKWPPVTIKT